MTETNPTLNAEDEECNVIHVVLAKESNKRKNKTVWYVLIAIFTISIIIGLSVLIWYVTSMNNEANNSKSNALYEIDSIHKDLNNFTESDYNTFDHGFDAFDTNNDGSLNMTEFRIFFEMQLDNTSTFERMDIDKDGILSYAECVAHLKYGIGTLESWMDSLSPLIYQNYGYNHSDLSISNTDLFFEYAAIVIYFDTFDVDNNGYIHKKEWLSISSQNEFLINDIDNDGEITEDEFLNIMYGTDERSWKGQIDHALKNPDPVIINKEMVKEVQMTLNLCPTQISMMENNRRRLGTAYVCIGYGCEWFDDGYCYGCVLFTWITTDPTCYVSQLIPAGAVVLDFSFYCNP
eukprot:90850_1